MILSREGQTRRSGYTKGRDVFLKLLTLLVSPKRKQNEGPEAMRQMWRVGNRRLAVEISRKEGSIDRQRPIQLSQDPRTPGSPPLTTRNAFSSGNYRRDRQSSAIGQAGPTVAAKLFIGCEIIVVP